MSAADQSKLFVEVLHNRDDDNHPDWSVGSGFLVGGALVLTAAHNVDGPGELLVRVDGKEEHPAVVRLQGDQDVADIALLEITDEYIAAPQCRYGMVNRTSRARIKCWAVGFPRFQGTLFKKETEAPYCPSRRRDSSSRELRLPIPIAKPTSNDNSS